MKKMIVFLFALLLMNVSFATVVSNVGQQHPGKQVIAGSVSHQKNITLSVSGMTCPVCPITVKKALEKIPGVTSVEVSFKEKTAVVTYNVKKTNIATLTAATKKAGYPSKLTK